MLGIHQIDADTVALIITIVSAVLVSVWRVAVHMTRIQVDLKGVGDAVETGFKRNSDDHSQIRDTLVDHTERLATVETRVDAHLQDRGNR